MGPSLPILNSNGVAKTMTTLLDTRGMQRAQSIDAWHRTVGTAVVPVVCRLERDCGFAGSIRQINLAQASLVLLSADSHQASRSRREVGMSGTDDLMWMVQMEGSMRMRVNGTECLVDAGEALLYDSRLAHRIVTGTHFVQLIFRFPRQWMPVIPAAVSVSLRRGAPRLALDYLLGIAQRSLELDHGELRSVTEGAVLLIERALSQSAVNATTAGETETTLLTVKRYISERLDDPELRIPDVAAAFAISSRTLSKLFARHGETVVGWITSRRLELARVDLITRPALPVSSIALRWGFADHAHFCRSFRSSYGVTPTECRAAASHSLDGGLTARVKEGPTR